MKNQIKYLIFKGIEKKERILFKSFLSLIKNDLPYQVVTLKSDVDLSSDPDIVIVDEDYCFLEEETFLRGIPTITVGKDKAKNNNNYITRPIHWHEFKETLTQLSLSSAESDAANERVLPNNVNLTIMEMTEQTVQSTSDRTDDEESFSGDYDYELAQLSIDYQSFTYSDYMKVVDDVMQFRDEQNANPDEHILLTTGAEDASNHNASSVKKHNLSEAWQFDEPGYSSERLGDTGKDQVAQFKRALEGKKVESVGSDPTLKKKSGAKIAVDEQYWLTANEILADGETFLFIMPQRGMVYSTYEPAKWPLLLKRKNLSRIHLDYKWRPFTGLKAYPISRLMWTHTMVNQTSELFQGLDEDQEYMLERWPHFDLLELDNILLKLCTMLFVKPESVTSLASKSGYGRSTVRGLMNACYEFGLLKNPAEIKLEKLVIANMDEGMLGKIKDVFR